MEYFVPRSIVFFVGARAQQEILFQMTFFLRLSLSLYQGKKKKPKTTEPCSH